MKKIKIIFSYDFLFCSSYYGKKVSSGKVEFIYPGKVDINNKNVIEQAAIIKGLNQDNINNSEIGHEIAKHLAVRLDAISDLSEKGWKVKYENNTLKVSREIRGVLYFPSRI